MAGAKKKGPSRKAAPQTKAAPETTREGEEVSEESGLDQIIEIPEIEVDTVALRLVGISPLVTHCWSYKALAIIRNKQQQQAASPRGAKNPEHDYEFARYRFFRANSVTKREQAEPKKAEDGRDGFPAHRIKEAMVQACSFLPRQVTKTLMRGAVFVNVGTYLVPLQYAKNPNDPRAAWLSYGVNVQPTMREDVERVGGKGKGTGAPDLRYRPQYDNWSIPIVLSFNRRLLSPAQLVNLLKVAGFHVGLGEHRPEKGGDWGMFTVVADTQAMQEAAE